MNNGSPILILNFNPHINKSLNTKNFINIKEPGGVELTELLVELREILNVEEVKLMFSDDNAVALIFNKKILFLTNSF